MTFKQSTGISTNTEYPFFLYRMDILTIGAEYWEKEKKLNLNISLFPKHSFLNQTSRQADRLQQTSQKLLRSVLASQLSSHAAGSSLHNSFILPLGTSQLIKLFSLITAWDSCRDIPQLSHPSMFSA